MSRRPRQREASSGTDGNRRLGVVFVLLVGLSGGMIALQADGSWLQVGLFVLGGIGAGSVLAWYLAWIAKRSTSVSR